MNNQNELEKNIKKLMIIARLEERKFEWYRNMFCILLLISPIFFFSTKVFGICYFSIMAYIMFYDQIYINPLEKKKKEAREKKDEKDNGEE
jgi:hypothetical protein